MDFPPKTRDAAGPPPDGRSINLEPSIGGEGLHAFADHYPEEQPASNAGPVSVTAAPEPRLRSSVWVERAFLVVFVCFCVWLGMLLIVLPWTPAWTQNSLILHYPGFRAFLGQNFVRGLASGLGLVDIWVGIWEAAHYREDKVLAS